LEEESVSVLAAALARGLAQSAREELVEVEEELEVARSQCSKAEALAEERNEAWVSERFVAGEAMSVDRDERCAELREEWQSAEAIREEACGRKSQLRERAALLDRVVSECAAVVDSERSDSLRTLLRHVENGRA